jgi:hypothetical protein
MNFDGMTKAEAETEKKRWTEKYFDYAEAPIKEWIAEVFEEDVVDLFDDYSNNSDILNVNPSDHNNKNVYTFYLTPFPVSQPAFNLTKKELLADKDLKRASSMMYEAVYTAYMPIASTMSDKKHLIEDAFPRFDESTMSFILMAMNGPFLKRQKLEKALLEVAEQFKRLKCVPDSDASAEMVADLEAKLDTVRVETEAELIKLTDDVCRKAQIECDNRNKKFVESSRLYVCVECNKQDISVDDKLRHMPQFGLKYQDPDEENYIDKLKDEYGVNE